MGGTVSGASSYAGRGTQPPALPARHTDVRALPVRVRRGVVLVSTVAFVVLTAYAVLRLPLLG